ncbi:MAG: hypothetical protein J2P37_02805 [Ktedonobacteraceae bacterium]|nr:hypothetical protein [Ktedonobacteraceae bacterium]
MDNGQSRLAPWSYQEVRQLGTALFNQQMWCWGQDIRRAEGNLLLAYGFTHQRPPAGTAGSTAYHLHRAERDTIVLWGFGVFYAQPALGGLFLKRYGFRPRLTPDAQPPMQAWGLEQLPTLRLPRCDEHRRLMARLFSPMLSWMGTYEAWVLQQYGSAYREQCLAQWRHPVCPAEQIASIWLSLAAYYESRGTGSPDSNY